MQCSATSFAPKPCLLTLLSVYVIYILVFYLERNKATKCLSVTEEEHKVSDIQSSRLLKIHVIHFIYYSICVKMQNKHFGDFLCSEYHVKQC